MTLKNPVPQEIVDLVNDLKDYPVFQHFSEGHLIALAHCVKLKEEIADLRVQLGAAIKAVELLDQAGFGTDGGNDLVTMVERAIAEAGTADEMLDA